MKKKFVIISLFCLLIMGITGYGSYVYFQTEEWENKIYSGIMVMEKIDVSGLTEEEAKSKLIDTLENQMLEKTIKVKIEEKVYEISYSEINADFDVDKTVEKAMKFGKDLSVLDKYKIKEEDNKVNLDLEFSYEESVLDGFIEKIKSGYDKEVIEPNLKMVKSGVFEVTPEQIGKRLNDKKLKEKMISNINADVDKKTIMIDAPIIIMEPSVRESMLKSVNTKIAEAKTSYKTSGEARSYNVALATSTMGSTLLMPGERFSFNNIVGERTVDRGYKVSKVIMNNKLVDGIGGGICQVSTTLYHAVMKTGLGFYERLNHSLPSSYSELGQDATVSWGSIDYQFTNTFDYPIFIEGYTKDKEVFVNIYSNKELADNNYVMVSEIVKTMEPKTIRTEDPELFVGEEVQVRKPITGYVVEVYRELREEGKVLKREFISKDTYQVVNEEIKVGTKIKESSETAVNN